MKIGGKLVLGLAILLIVLPILSLILYNLEVNPISTILNKPNVFIDSGYNTFYLLIITVFISIIFGLFPAWFVSLYSFKFKTLVDFLLYLPLAIPTYIMAFSYGEILSFTGPFQLFLRNYIPALSPFFNMDYLTIEVLGCVLGFSLFPYVYAASRISFTLIGQSYIHLSKMLGLNNLSTFFKVVLPLSTPAILSAVFLVCMEVLNEYGATKYFGVNTFTTEIFKTWYSLNDVGAAVGLSVVLLITVMTLYVFEQMYNAKTKINYKENTQLDYTFKKTISATKPILFCIIPILFGFVFPFIFILKNTIDNILSFNFIDTLSLAFNSISLSLLSSLLIVLVLFYILFVDKEYKTRASKTLNIFSSIGYALPGAVLALSLIIMSSQIKNNITSISLIGTFYLLIHAYFIRFMAVGKSPIKSSIDKMPDNLSESAKNLGLGNLGLAMKLYLPLNKFALLTAFLLCFIDLMKELPMTLILRPFNFDTLATKTYEFAVEEMVDLSSIYSLIIIFVCSVSLFIVKKINHK